MSSREENLAVVVASCAALIMASLNNKKRKIRHWWRTELYKKRSGSELMLDMKSPYICGQYKNFTRMYRFREFTKQNRIQNFQRGNIIRKMLANSSTNKILPQHRSNLNWASLLCSSKKTRLSAVPYERFVRRSVPRLNYTNLVHERLHYSFGSHVYTHLKTLDSYCGVTAFEELG
jgi:hypothetical protein